MTKLQDDIERMLAEAPDEASRAEIERLRERLNSPELRALARANEHAKPRKSRELALEFHDPLLPMAVTAGGSIVATGVCLFAIVNGFDSTVAKAGGAVINLWILAAISGAFSVCFTALSFARSFTVRFDTVGMVSSISGSRWKDLRVGAMRWTEIRSLRERPDKRVLEVHGEGDVVLDIPMRIGNFPILEEHLANVVLLYGDGLGRG
jgi:hypothetical protein